MIFQRIASAVILSGLLAGCGQPSPASGEVGGPASELDFIDAVPIDEDTPAPVVQPEPAAKTDVPETKAESPQAPATPATPPPEPAAQADDATVATRRAKETTSNSEVSAPPETVPRPD